MKSNGSIHSSNSTLQGKTPMLVFDVYLGESKGLKHLLIFEDDKPGVIARKFRDRHEMNDKQRLKLEALLQLKMLNHKRKQHK